MGQNDALNHLTEDQLSELMARYYRGDHVHDLIERFGLECSTNTLWRQFPAKRLDQPCHVCGAPLWEERLPRTKHLAGVHPSASCTHCGHIEGAPCHCPACERQRADEASKAARREKDEIAGFCSRHWSYERRQIEPGDLSLKAAVALIALVRSGGWDDKENVRPWGASGAPWTPDAIHYQRHLLNTLLGEQLVAPFPDSEAFPESTRKERTWRPEHASWVVLHPAPTQFIRQIIETAESEVWPEEWRQHWMDVGQSLGHAEGWEFCSMSMERRNLPMPGETALKELITDLLRHFSVSRCYRLLWMGAARATDAMAQRNLNRKHAANYMIGACQRAADRARAEGWDLKGFGRNHDLPRSEMSHVLHDVFLNHGEDGFYQCPSQWGKTA